MMQVNTFEALECVVHQPQKNVNNVVKERWKNWLLQSDQLLICFQPSLTEISPKMNLFYLLLYLLIFSPKNIGKKVRKTRFESQTRAVHDLSELLRVKTVQIDKYRHVLDNNSNLYRRHQMVQSFLWMKLNKTKDDPGSHWQGSAQVVVNSFNRRAYTGRKIIQWERSWVQNYTIPGTKAGKH